MYYLVNNTVVALSILGKEKRNENKNNENDLYCNDMFFAP